MNYTFNHLRIYLKVTQTKSITKAAEELHLTQPAVSIQMKNFQDQFVLPLTEIIGRKLYVTDFGREIAVAAENILNEVYAINYKALSFKGKVAGKLKLSIVSTGEYVMPYFLSEFIKKNEGIELQIDVTNKVKVVESLEKNEVDFSLVSVLPVNLQTEKVELIENKLFLVGNSEQQFNKRPYDKNIFKTLPLIYREAGSGTRHTMEQYFERNNLSITKKLELTSNEAVKQAVIAGLGYSIMPLIGIKNELGNGDLQIIPVKGFPIKTNWNLIWLKEKKFSLVAASFLDFINKEKNRIVHEKFAWSENY
jgi:DNA-binding transcriptional LysR family regulator